MRSAVPSRQLAGTKNVGFNLGMPADFVNAEARPSLIILDDLLNHVYSNNVCDLSTKCSHLRKFSEILIIQKIFHRAQ